MKTEPTPTLASVDQPQLVRPFVLARPWERGLPTNSWQQRKRLRIHKHGIRVGEREIPKEKTNRTFPDDGKLWPGDYVQDGTALYIAKYNWGGFFTLHRFIFRFGANSRDMESERFPSSNCSENGMSEQRFG